MSSPSQLSVGTELPSTPEDGEGDCVEVLSCDDFYGPLFVGTVSAVGFTLGVSSVVCSKHFSEGLVGLVSGRLASGSALYAIGRNFRDPLDIDVTLGSVGGGSTQFDSEVPEGPSLDLEDW